MQNDLKRKFYISTGKSVTLTRNLGSVTSLQEPIIILHNTRWVAGKKVFSKAKIYNGHTHTYTPVGIYTDPK